MSRRTTTTYLCRVIELLFYSLSLAFQVDFSSVLGHSGFLVFWMANYVSMLAVGLALEAMVTHDAEIRSVLHDILDYYQRRGAHRRPSTYIATDMRSPSTIPPVL
ncbi:hypothetical protein DFS33DRAFT_1380645 [Desarmillaria ectypa]|nr:hypothetical protein DFS33DRAFT_1380645 [Desarmillaria ectypa]